MIPELGNFALALACCLALAQAIMGIWGAHRRNTQLMGAVPGLAIGQLLALCGGGGGAGVERGARRFFGREHCAEQFGLETSAL